MYLSETGRGPSVRVAVTCRTERLVAEDLGCLFPTPRISDLAWLHADVHEGPVTPA